MPFFLFARSRLYRNIEEGTSILNNRSVKALLILILYVENNKHAILDMNSVKCEFYESAGSISEAAKRLLQQLEELKKVGWLETYSYDNKTKVLDAKFTTEGFRDLQLFNEDGSSKEHDDDYIDYII